MTRFTLPRSDRYRETHSSSRPTGIGRLPPVRDVAFGCALVHSSRKTSIGPDRQSTCTMRFWVISQLARLRIGVRLDYSLVHGPESMPPDYAATEIRPLAPDRNGGSANDASLGPP